MLTDVTHGVDHHVIFVSLRQLFPGLLRRHILGVPVGPVLVALPGALLVLAVGDLRTPQRARQVACRAERSPGSRINTPGQPGRDLLQQPPVGVRVVERGEGSVGGVIGCGPADATARAVGLELSARRSGVEHLADVDTEGDELVARSLDVGDDQVEAVGRPGRGRGDFRPELYRAPRTGRRELDDPEAVIEGEVGVEPPPEVPVELLRAVDIGDRDDDRPRTSCQLSRGSSSLPSRL